MSYEPVVLQSRARSPGAVALSSSADKEAYSPVPGASMSPGSSAASVSSDQIVASMRDHNNEILYLPTTSTSHPQDPTMHQGTVRRVVSSLSESQSAGNLTRHSSSSLAMLAPASPSSTRSVGKPSPSRGRRTSAKASRGSSGGDKVPEARRQKRLERNRESARLSRRRRKQYLEILEDRVTQLSEEMDLGRRTHVSAAVRAVDYKRRDVLEHGPVSVESLPALESSLSRTNQELMLTTTFQFQQLKSFSIPASTKFNLWLSLQGEAYFRGGRAASERLSAARIGERMLNSGTDKVTPMQSMWPLLCNEVGLSYEQEEKIRNVQRSILLDHPTWVDRHSAHASTKLIQSAHDAVQALALRFGQREKTNHAILTPEQRIKFLSWSARNRERASKVVSDKVPNDPYKGEFDTSKGQHLAANLYILNHRLEMVLEKIPRAAPLVSDSVIKKLSRRPEFESLGFCLKEKDDEDLSREKSFASMGSMKRSASGVSMDMDSEEKPSVPAVVPYDAEVAAAPVVERVLGHLSKIIPPPPVPTVPIHMALPMVMMPAPTPLSNMAIEQPYPQVITSSAVAAAAPLQEPSLQASVAMIPTPIAPYPEPLQQVSAPQRFPYPHHIRKSSFLPPELNVVPEDMWPADATTEFLMELADDGWNIGQGVYMDTMS